VARNRLKRRLREISRRELLPALDRLGESADILVRVRAEAYGAEFGALRQELLHWIDRRWPNASP
jgi:ribonuclease P protein component